MRKTVTADKCCYLPTFLECERLSDGSTPTMWHWGSGESLDGGTCRSLTVIRCTYVSLFLFHSFPSPSKTQHFTHIRIHIHIHIKTQQFGWQGRRSRWCRWTTRPTWKSPSKPCSTARPSGPARSRALVSGNSYVFVWTVVFHFSFSAGISETVSPHFLATE
jgi:hypothetical protein